MRGRRPVGPEYVQKLAGSDASKQRLQLILETLCGRVRLQEAAARMGISEIRFHQLRQDALQAALTGIEPGTAGRPSTKTTAAQQVQALAQALAEKEQELHAAQVREEVALILPRVVQAPPKAEKKTRHRRKRRRAPRP
jgi:hypothetical protein